MKYVDGHEINEHGYCLTCAEHHNWDDVRAGRLPPVPGSDEEASADSGVAKRLRQFWVLAGDGISEDQEATWTALNVLVDEARRGEEHAGYGVLRLGGEGEKVGDLAQMTGHPRRKIHDQLGALFREWAQYADDDVGQVLAAVYTALSGREWPPGSDSSDGRQGQQKPRRRRTRRSRKK